MGEESRGLRIRVEKGVTIPVPVDSERGVYRYERSAYAVETDIPSGMTLAEGIKDLENVVEGLINERVAAVKPPASPPAQPKTQPATSTQPQIPPPTVASTPEESVKALENRWKCYDEAKPWKGSWIFSNLPEAEKLKAALLAAPNKTVEIGEYTYRLSGDEDKFLSRRKTKKT